jgi:hypothetical protein
MTKLFILTSLLFSLFSVGSYANEFSSSYGNPAINFTREQPQSMQVRDPFTISPLMYELMGTQNNLNNSAFGFIPNLGNTKVPEMKLRAYIEKENEPPIALLEIKGAGSYMVREGDEINIDPSNPRQAIRISKITRLSITVETGTLGSIRILR